MTLTKDQQKAGYPLPAYNFRVTVDGAAMSFAEVSGIHVERESVTYRHGFSFWEGEGIKTYRYDKFVPVTLKKGTVKGFSELYDWINEQQTRPRMVEVSLCDEEGRPLVTWRIRKAVPVKLEAPTFDAKTNEVSVESLELMVRGITIEHH